MFCSGRDRFLQNHPSSFLFPLDLAHTEDKYKVETKTIAVDYSKFSPEVSASVKSELDQLEIGVLGMFYAQLLRQSILQFEF